MAETPFTVLALGAPAPPPRLTAASFNDERAFPEDGAVTMGELAASEHLG